MIEIAIALGVIAFALVAIVGILPLGLTVQRDNRAETIINQDATYWLEAIRDGAQGLDDLSNYVDEIVVTDNLGNILSYTYGPNGMGANPPQFLYGSNIVSLLTNPYSDNDPVAYVRSISGAAAEKGSEVAFKYQMTVSTLKVETAPLVAPLNLPPPTLYEISLAFRWPVTRINATPETRRPPLRYRTLASRIVTTNYLNGPGSLPEFYLFAP